MMWGQSRVSRHTYRSSADVDFAPNRSSERLRATVSHNALDASQQKPGLRVNRRGWNLLIGRFLRGITGMARRFRVLKYKSKRRIRRARIVIARARRKRKTAPKKATAFVARRSPRLLALEPRIVFDAAAGATADHAADQVAQQQAASAAQHPNGDHNGKESGHNEQGSGPDGAPDGGQDGDGSGHAGDAADAGDLPLAIDTTGAASRVEIAFIDPNVSDVDTLVAGLDPSVEIVMLDADQDGVEQIAAALSGRSDVDAIHILSHGKEGSLSLGTAKLDLESMQGEHLDELTAIGHALTENGDILVYGCDFAGGQAGIEATAALSAITGADVAASTDETGAADLGGDWDLETSVGTIDAHVLEATTYEGLLAPLSVTPLGTGGVTLDGRRPGDRWGWRHGHERLAWRR